MSFALFALDSFSKILYLRTKFVDQYVCYFSQWKKKANHLYSLHSGYSTNLKFKE